MADKYINELEINGQKRLDLTQDTATPETVLEGETFHLRSGAPATGAYRPSDEIEARLRATVGHSSKNLLKLEASTQMSAGITYTVNEKDGTVTATGTVTTGQNSYCNIAMDLPEGNYYFYGCPTGGSNSKYDIFPWDNTTTARPKQWDGTTEAVSDYDMTPKQFKAIAGHSLRLSIRIRSGQTVNNIVFKPMVWDGSIADDTFELYVTPTDERIVDLEARVAALEAIINNR